MITEAMFTKIKASPYQRSNKGWFSTREIIYMNNHANNLRNYAK